MVGVVVCHHHLIDSSSPDAGLVEPGATRFFVSRPPRIHVRHRPIGSDEDVWLVQGSAIDTPEARCDLGCHQEVVR